jgi:hypothetical protein
MTKLARLVCMIAAAGAALPMLAHAHDPITQVQVRRHIPLVVACPQAMQELPATLYKSWREIDTPADVQVDLKLDGGKVTDVAMSGGQGEYDNMVRRAVKSMTCVRPGEGAYSVRFHIKFRYDEESSTATAGLQFVDDAVALAAR